MLGFEKKMSVSESVSHQVESTQLLSLGALHFRLLILGGHKPGSVGLHRATIFHRDGNRLGL